MGCEGEKENTKMQKRGYKEEKLSEACGQKPSVYTGEGKLQMLHL